VMDATAHSVIWMAMKSPTRGDTKGK
jgi:hypothetical protein